MSCFHPLTAIDCSPPFRRPGDKRVIRFGLPHNLEDYEYAMSQNRVLQLPCGQCVGCRLDYSRSWADRCMCEASYHDSSYFITFTYDDEHLPRTFISDLSTGECISPVATLSSRDFTNFLKRLRYYFSDDHIRYFACGEYGDNSLRPHYHGIFFGLHLDDLVYYKNSDKSFPYFTSKKLERAWSDVNGNRLGLCVVANVSWDTCAYTARYLLKKQRGEAAKIYQSLNIEPPFSRASRRPGIGRQYYEDHPDMFKYAYCDLCTPSGGHRFRPSSYYKRLYGVDNPEDFERYQNQSLQNAINQKELKLSLTSLDEYDSIILAEKRKLDKMKALRRNLL